MDIFLTNTYGNKKELFKPIHKGKVSMYHCGPTVYDQPHIGNLRALILADTLRRVFEYNGYEVKQIMNITDVDDKTIRGSIKAEVSLPEFTRKYAGIFLSQLDRLNVLEPTHLPRATDHIKDMIKLVQKLLDSKHAYKTEDGIYFSISSFKDYGKLSQVEKRTEARSRMTNDEYAKEDASDFALWKFHTEYDGEIAWNAAFGEGRPGWHIECSAMAMDALGHTIDIHTGGVDLMFPHHENEIAQSEAATGEHFVNYWLHNGFLMVGGKKMAKSDGGFITLPVMVEKGISPLAFKYWLLTGHYRTLMNFTWEAVEGAQKAYNNLAEAYAGLHTEKKDAEDAEDIVKGYEQKFSSALNDDLNTPQAIATLWNMVRDQKLGDRGKALLIERFDKALGIGIVEEGLRMQNEEKAPVPERIQAIAGERETARKNKDWKRADELRVTMEAAGYSVNDGPQGQKIIKKL